MKGVLILAHGSREKATEQTLDAIISELRGMLPEMVIETAYLQFSAVNLAAGLDALAEKGIDDIAVVPYFLFAGVHICEDIPQELAQYRKKHPDLRIALGETLGADRRLAEILADRVKNAL